MFDMLVLFVILCIILYVLGSLVVALWCIDNYFESYRKDTKENDDAL